MKKDTLSTRIIKVNRLLLGPLVSHTLKGPGVLHISCSRPKFDVSDSGFPFVGPVMDLVSPVPHSLSPLKTNKTEV